MATFDKHTNPLDDPQALQAHIDRALNTPEPTGLEQQLVYRAVKRLFRPTLVGADNIPDQPCLFVCNHSLFALDGWVLGPVLQMELGRWLRPLGDKFLFAIKGVGDAAMKRGGVMGHPAVCAALMEDGQDLLVFPGGAHEAVKPEHQFYSLQWKERYGFVKLAARHGYTIQPVGMVGPDEFYSHLMEGEELPDSALGALLRRAGLLTDSTRRDILPPIPLGLLGTPLPKPQPCYIGFGKPLDLSQYLGRRPQQRTLEKLRARVAAEIEEQMSKMLMLRARESREQGVVRRLLTL